jgi:hypothetical protein
MTARNDHADSDFSEVLVSPRYLAGFLGIGDSALQPMLDAEWPHHNDEIGNFYISSPDQHLRAGFLPEADYPLWYIAAASDPFGAPLWTAWASSAVPEEIIGAVLRTLADEHHTGSEDYLAGSRQTVIAYKPLADAGWTPYPGQRAPTIISPDGMASLTYDPHADDRPRGTPQGPEIHDAWQISAGQGSGHWFMTFTRATPAHIVAAATTALSDPTPVLREKHLIPREHLSHVTTSAPNPPGLPSGPRRPPLAPAPQTLPSPTDPRRR